MMKTVYHTHSDAETRQMPGFAFKILADSKTTGGDYALMHAKARKGATPGLHYHDNEDEAFFMLKGEMWVTIGEERYHARPGDYVSLPRGIPHKQEIITDEIEALLILSPAGYEGYFRELSQEAGQFEAPPVPQGPPPEEMMQKLQAVNKKYDITMLEK